MTERELKLVIEPAEYLRLASALPDYAGERWMANHYFDTSDRALRTRGAMLRIRETERGRTAGLKQAIVVLGGSFEAAEREEPIQDADWRRVARAGGDLGILDHSVIREAFALAGAAVLRYLGSVRVLRKAYRIATDSVLELDLACYEDGTQDCELELETERPECVRPFVEELLERRGVSVREQTRTKYQRFLDRPESEPLELCESLAGEVVTVGDGVLVQRTPLGGPRVVATRAFAPGDAILELEGSPVEGDLPPRRGTHFLQVGATRFLDLRRTIGRHVGHSCAPNAGIRGERTLVAMQGILPEQEVRRDYAMTEYDLDRVCCCGTAACRGRIGGYRVLSSNLRAAYGPWVADHLRGSAAPEPEAP
nr:CYTH domain-containing protein [Gemmatimonadota bacterium]